MIQRHFGKAIDSCYGGWIIDISPSDKVFHTDGVKYIKGDLRAIEEMYAIVPGKKDLHILELTSPRKPRREPHKAKEVNKGWYEAHEPVTSRTNGMLLSQRQKSSSRCLSSMKSQKRGHT